MNKLLVLTVVMIVYLLSAPAILARSIEFPFTESLDTNNYGDIAFFYPSDGSTFEHRASGGWSGGCARFTPPTSVNTVQSRRAGIGGLGFRDGAQSEVYVRFLFRTSSNFEEDVRNRGYGTQDKILILNPVSGSRGMSIYEQCRSQACGSQDYYTLGACQDNMCIYESLGPNQSNPQGTDSFKSEDYEEEWVCFEVRISSTNISSVYITTQDGRHSGLYLSREGALSPQLSIQGIGWYFNGYYSGSAWFEIDEIAVDDKYIGPPAGFVGSDPVGPPNAPQNFRIVK